MSDLDDDIGARCAELAQLSSDLADSISDEVLLYIEVEAAYVYVALYEYNHDQVTWLESGEELPDAVLKFWYEVAQDEKWSGFVMIIANGTFSVEFIYADFSADDEEPNERRQKILDERYRDVPVVYPSLDEFDGQP